MSRLMVVDDNKDILHLLKMRLQSSGHTVETAESAEQALAFVPTFQPQLVITDLRMDGMDGMALFEKLKFNQPSLPIIIITAHGSIPHAIEATKRGAFSYFTKPFDSNALLEEVDKALSLAGNKDNQGNGNESSAFAEIVTRNADVLEALQQANMVAASEASVLIQSESGTGKELLACAIHKASPRADKPFVALNCSSVPDSLLESELFGHVKGAFTGANRDHQGLIQAAEGGTLFLDEVGDMPLEFQVKLLRVLQEREVRPVGSTGSKPIDVRVICATHRDLEALIEEGSFREDLYYRLNVVQLELPALRARRDDIPLLAQHFLEQLSPKGKAPRHFSAEAMEALASASWPGNIRQLRNVVEQTMVLSHTTVIPEALVKRALKKDDGEIVPFADARDHFERDYLVEVLHITAGNVTQAAQLARRNRTEFYRLLRRHHLDPHSFRGQPSARQTL
ncbi:two component, sigma54 specific, transcriptional regulator, Fis family [Spongiibacter sp. IMCC21906]|uniref:sigma 54-interacting transcriptional regulator n=1 Tax=Spongiibacter sp. IMCC21906 TaxID=1620392 RepID=UPI00062DD3D9|nr:sigma 54-interacting transcriptional regulator [Spongiibacter sp. IMCC21906]AKH68707.1 two component, sigma54 specific, transcriptional regulator, Fis family [Spongiibacter sp. IMCC21906]